MTRYRVLRQSGTNSFDVIAEGIEANGAQAAIRAVASKEENPAGTYVAVPESNWTEEPVAVERRDPILRIGGVPGQTTVDDVLTDGGVGIAPAGEKNQAK